MRPGWLALCIGLGIGLVVFGISAVGWSGPMTNGRDIVYPSLFYLGLPGLALQMAFQWMAPGALRTNPNLFVGVMHILKAAGDVAFYGLAAYAVLRLAAKRKSAGESIHGGEANDRPRAKNQRRRLWLALGIGLGLAGVAAACDYIPFTRQIPNGHQVTTVAQLHPSLTNLDLPGLLLMMFLIGLTPAHWGDHQRAARVLVTSGDAASYSLAAYVILWLTARWQRR